MKGTGKAARTCAQFAIASVTVAIIAAGCGSEKRESLAKPDAAVVDDATVTPVVDSSVFADAPGPDPFCKGIHCTSDLHKLVDCSGNVQSECPADQGCTLGGCLPACEAAKVNKSSVGCDYYVLQPDVIIAAAGGCFAAAIANTWSTPVTIGVERDGQVLNPTEFGYIPSGSGKNITYTPLTTPEIPAGQVALFFLSQAPSLVPGTACPPNIKAALTTDGAFHGTGVGRAFHFTATAPVVAVDIFPYGGGETALTSATLLLPTSSWDTNYVTVDAWSGSNFVEQSVVAIVAQEDATDVTFRPSTPLQGGGGVDAGAAGAPQTYSLQKGHVLQFTQAQSLTGSIVLANKPVGVWGGRTGLTIDTCCGESSHQQIPGVKALGSEYVGVRYRNRYDGVEESPPWRILGAVDGTILTWDPAPPGGAPMSLAAGQIVEFRTGSPFVVRSQDADHPFYLSAHMTGAGQFDVTQKDGRGDAEFVNVVPPLEYLDSYVFFADPTYPETNLVVVRRRGDGGFADVMIDCDPAPLTGWLPIGLGGLYEYTRFDLVRGNFQAQGNCSTGRREMHSKNAFGVTVWGWGSAASNPFNSQYVSYAYPAGAGAAPINTVVVSPIK